jgi:tetratricopeptide (TPR) repeat protein
LIGRWGQNALTRGIGVAVGAAAVGAFLPVVDNLFVVQWDDGANFLTNHAFRGLDWAEIRWAWTTRLLGVYQPISWMLMEAEYSLVGLAPAGYHFGSLLLHAANTVLFYLLVRNLVSRALPEVEPGRRWAITVMSGLMAAWFAVHPLRVEVVAWASCQPYLPSAGLAILSVLAYLRGCGGGRRHLGWLMASFGLYGAALGCKSIAIGLPVVLLILDGAVLRRLGPGRSTPGVWIEKLPFLALAVAAALVAIDAKGGASRLLDPEADGLLMLVKRVAIAGYGLAYHLRKTVWPTGLSAFHYRPARVELTDPRFAVSLAAVAAIVIAAVVIRRRWPAIPAALLAYAALLAPNLGLVSYDRMLVSERSSYLATMPVFALAAGGLVGWVAVSRRPRAVAAAIVAAGIGGIVVLSAMSRAQCRTWGDSETLVAHALQVGSGRDGLLLSSFGLDLIATGRDAAGMAQLRKAIAVDPADPDARVDLGITLGTRGNPQEAIHQLAEAVRLAPGRFDLHHHLGLALYWEGDLERAVEQLTLAARLRPDRAQVHVSLGDALAALKRNDEAARQFAQALRLEPGHFGARSGLAKLQRRD